MRPALLIVVSLVLLASCQSIPESGTWLADSRDWFLEGKVSLRSEGDTRTATIDWRQQGDQSEINLRGPLGAGAVRIVAGEQGLVIEADGQTRHYPITADLLVDGNVWRLPWRSLSWWVRGVQGPGQEPIGDSYRDGDWSVRVLKSDESGPRLMEFNHARAAVRLRIRRWITGPGAGGLG